MTAHLCPTCNPWHGESVDLGVIDVPTDPKHIRTGRATVTFRPDPDRSDHA